MGGKIIIEDNSDKFLTSMGKQLGQLFFALHKEIIWLNVKWKQFCSLYAHTPQRLTLLNETAALFFRIIQNVLWDDVLLHIARLTDSPKSMGKDNLTILRLPPAIPDKTISNEIQHLVDTTVKKSTFARDWRNRYLAHRDLSLVLQEKATPLSQVNHKNMDHALAALADTLNHIYVHYFGRNYKYEYFMAYTDADSLVHHLHIAADIEKHHNNV